MNLANEQQGKTPDSEHGEGKAQATRPSFDRLKRVWQWIALMAAVSFLILGELAFQWVRYKGWITHTEDGGLARDSVHSIAVTPDAAVWVGTHHGVVRFDGGSWTTYAATNAGLADDEVNALAVGWTRLGMGGNHRGVERS